jgi:NAD(P)H-hydrate epimerase
VGCLLAKHLRALTTTKDRILLLAGNGHNGDDTRAAARNLLDREVKLLEIHEAEAGLDALNQALAWGPNWLVDGLFGIGLNRPLNSAWIRLIEAVNTTKLPVLAVDVPSGLDAQTGRTWGAAVRARVTVTVGAPKIGMMCPPAWPYTGRLLVEPEIGLLPPPVESELWWTLPEDFSDFPPRPDVDAHKGTRGHLVIFAGSRGYHGAAVLAARAAQRARPGLITLGTLPEVYVPVAAQLQAVMVDGWREALAKMSRATGCLLGPGLAAADLPMEFRASMIELWRNAPVPIVADANALDWLPAGSCESLALRVITPHPGEAARLLRVGVQAIQQDRLGAVRALSRGWNQCWVVLKGFQTLVGRDRGTVWVNCSGDASLAQGGTGDILAGFLGGLLAQPDLAKMPEMTLRYAVWKHGAGADRASEQGRQWVPEELIAELGVV